MFRNAHNWRIFNLRQLFIQAMAKKILHTIKVQVRLRTHHQNYTEQLQNGESVRSPDPTNTRFFTIIFWLSHQQSIKIWRKSLNNTKILSRQQLRIRLEHNKLHNTMSVQTLIKSCQPLRLSQTETEWTDARKFNSFVSISVSSQNNKCPTTVAHSQQFKITHTFFTCFWRKQLTSPSEC